MISIKVKNCQINLIQKLITPFSCHPRNCTRLHRGCLKLSLSYRIKSQRWHRCVNWHTADQKEARHMSQDLVNYGTSLMTLVEFKTTSNCTLIHAAALVYSTSWRHLIARVTLLICPIVALGDIVCLTIKLLSCPHHWWKVTLDVPICEFDAVLIVWTIGQFPRSHPQPLLANRIIPRHAQLWSCSLVGSLEFETD